MQEDSSEQTDVTVAKPSRLDVFNDPRMALAAVFIMVLVVYWGTLSFDYVNYDDLTVLNSNPLIQSLSPASIKHMFTHFHPQSYYPVRLLSYALDFKVWGGEPMGYHLTNLLLHLFNVLMVFWLFLSLAKEQSKKNIWGAFVAGAFFGIHPVVAGSVAWIPGREELLLFFFGLWCLQFQVLGQAGKYTVLCLILSAAACVLACLSNAMGAAIPLVAALYVYSVSREKKARTAFSRTWLLWVIGAGAVFLKILAVLAWDSQTMEPVISHVPTAWEHMGQLWSKHAAAQGADPGLWQHILIVFSVFGGNVLHGLIPYSLPVFYPPQSPQSLTDLNVLCGLGFFLCMAALFFGIRKKEFWWLGLMWFLAVTLMTSQIFPTFVWRADRFLYLPLGGLALALGWLAAVGQERLGEHKSAFVFMALLVVLGARTITYLPVFSNAMSFHYYAVNANQEYYLVYEYMGQEYARQGMFKESLKYYAKALDLAPDKHYLWAKVLKAVIMGGDVKYGERLGKLAVKSQPDNAYRQNYYGAVLSLSRKSNKAIQHFKIAAELDPAAVEPIHNLGMEYIMAGKSQEAVPYLKKAHDLSPFNTRIAFDLARALERTGQTEQAMEYYRQAARDPQLLEARRALERLKASEHHDAGNASGVERDKL